MEFFDAEKTGTNQVPSNNSSDMDIYDAPREGRDGERNNWRQQVSHEATGAHSARSDGGAKFAETSVTEANLDDLTEIPIYGEANAKQLDGLLNSSFWGKQLYCHVR